jgi:CRP-like cAMP-binding protein
MEHLRGGDLIFKEGDKSNDKLYIIFNGKVGLIKARP